MAKEKKKTATEKEDHASNKQRTDNVEKRPGDQNMMILKSIEDLGLGFIRIQMLRYEIKPFTLALQDSRPRLIWS